MSDYEYPIDIVRCAAVKLHETYVEKTGQLQRLC